MRLNKANQNFNQKGLSLIEFALTILISVPCIVFVQNQVMKIFDDVIANNMVYSFYEISSYIGSELQHGDFPFRLTPYGYTQISTEEILSNQYFSISLSAEKVHFYIKAWHSSYTGKVDGYFVLGVLQPPEKLHISRLIAYNILGSSAGYFNNNIIISINNSFADIHLEEDPVLKRIPRNVTSIVYYGYFPANKNNHSTIIVPHLNAGSVILDGKELIFSEGNIDLSHCDLKCMNEMVQLSWIEQGYRNLGINLIVDDGMNSSSLELAVPVLPGVYYLSVGNIINKMKSAGLISTKVYQPVTLRFCISGTNVNGNSSCVPFLGKIILSHS